MMQFSINVFFPAWVELIVRLEKDLFFVFLVDRSHFVPRTSKQKKKKSFRNVLIGLRRATQNKFEAATAKVESGSIGIGSFGR